MTNKNLFRLFSVIAILAIGVLSESDREYSRSR